MTRHKPTLIRDHFQNFKGYNLPRAQLVIADIPYNVGDNAYGSNPQWYIDGDNKNGASELAGTRFFSTDENFNSHEFMHFCSRLMKPEPKNRNDAPCMIVFCSFEQQFGLIELARKFGINNYLNLVFRKSFSAQVLKANMRVVGNAEYGLILYRDKLPKFRNNGKMIFNVIDWLQDDQSSPLYRKVHPTQKPIALLEYLINIFTDPGDVVIDPVAGSGSALLAAHGTGRRGFGFEIDRKLHAAAADWIDFNVSAREEIEALGYSPALLRQQRPEQCTLFATGG